MNPNVTQGLEAEAHLSLTKKRYNRKITKKSAFSISFAFSYLSSSIELCRAQCSGLIAAALFMKNFSSSIAQAR